MRPPKPPLKFKQASVIKRKALTVCIAAFAEKSRAIVCIADRAVTYPSYGSPVQSDSGMKKIVDVGGTKWCALFSGDTSFAQQVIARIANKADASSKSGTAIDFPWMNLNGVAAYQECYEETVENQVLRPNLLTRTNFLNRPSTLQPLDPKFIESVNSKLQEFQLSCQIMLCGFDLSGPHILTLVEPGTAQWNDLEGHNAVGIGKETATSRLAWLETEPSESLPSVLYDTFDAKVASEIIQGVGYEWDGKIITSERGPIDVPKKIKKVIDQVWIVNNQTPYATSPVDKDDVPPKTWRSILQHFCDDCLSSSA